MYLFIYELIINCINNYLINYNKADSLIFTWILILNYFRRLFTVYRSLIARLL